MMDDKLIFLGTGGGRFVTLYQSRATGGVIFNTSEEQIHIDPGPGALLRAKEYDVNLWNTSVVCLTHKHFDHVNDAPAVLEILRMKKKKGVLLASKSCFEEIVPKHLKDEISIVVLKRGSKVKINNNLMVEATGTKHGDSDGIGLKFKTINYGISFVSDTGYYADLSKEHKDSDILVINLMKPKGYESEKHLCYSGAKRLLQEVKPRACVITHFGIKALKSGPLDLARELERETGIRTVAATDGAKMSIQNLLRKAY